MSTSTTSRPRDRIGVRPLIVTISLIDIFLAVTALGAMAHFVLRFHVIGLVRELGRFEEFGSPKNFSFNDGLPLRSFSMSGLTTHQRRWVRGYFISWILHGLLPVAVLLKLFVA